MFHCLFTRWNARVEALQIAIQNLISSVELWWLLGVDETTLLYWNCKCSQWATVSIVTHTYLASSPKKLTNISIFFPDKKFCILCKFICSRTVSWVAGWSKGKEMCSSLPVTLSSSEHKRALFSGVRHWSHNFCINVFCALVYVFESDVISFILFFASTVLEMRRSYFECNIVLALLKKYLFFLVFFLGSPRSTFILGCFCHCVCCDKSPKHHTMHMWMVDACMSDEGLIPLGMRVLPTPQLENLRF